MKAKKNLLALSLLAAAVALSACSKDKNKGSGANPDSENGKVTQKAFSEKYQFELNGCDTGKHEFSSNSQADVKKQLCVALQNEELNKRCAQPLRKGFFDKKCSGVAWNPVYPTPSSPTQPSTPSQPSTPTGDAAQEIEIREALKYVLVESYQVKDGLNADLSTFANTLSEDMRSCGFSYVGPKCLDYNAFAGSYEGDLHDPEGENIFLTDLSFQGIDSQILFAFSIKDDSSSEEVKVFVKNQKKEISQSISDYLKSSSVQLLSTIKISEDFITVAEQRLQSPSSLQEMYHMARQLDELNRSDGNSAPVAKKILDAIVANKSLFASAATDYHYITYYLTSNLGAKKDQKIAIAKELMKSSSEEIKQFAAVQVLVNDSSREDLKPLVVKALNHKRWTVRRDAINGLSNANPSVEEQNKIIAKMDDNDGNVRNIAFAATQRLNLRDSHFSTLKSLSSSQYWTTRRNVSGLIAKIPGSQSNNHLVGSMSDNDGNVRNAVFDELSKKQLGVESVSALSEQQKSEYWTVRRNAATLLGKINDKSAVEALIGKMSDNDGNVRNTIFEQLDSKDLESQFVANLESQQSSDFWTVRRNAASIIGKIEGGEATKALIKHMSDNDENVRNEIISQLKSRTFAVDLLVDLENQRDSQYWTVRRDLTELFSKISDAKATVSLIEMMSDNDGNVRNSVVKALNSRTMNNSFVAHFKKQFSSDSWTTRGSVAMLLGKIKTQDSLDALLDQLASENDGNVKNQIEASIAAIRN